MERLTEHQESPLVMSTWPGDSESLRTYNRLAAYEDIGMEPNEIEDFINRWKEAVELAGLCKKAGYDRLRELAEADKDGRCVVLPCKVGDKVFVRSDTWGNVWNFKTVDCGKLLVGEIIGFAKTRKQTLMKIQVQHNVSWKRERERYPVSALGITVFLTREAAEAALEESHG